MIAPSRRIRFVLCLCFIQPDADNRISVLDTFTVSLQREATVSLPEVSEDFGQTTALSNAVRFPKEIAFFRRFPDFCSLPFW